MPYLLQSLLLLSLFAVQTTWANEPSTSDTESQLVVDPFKYNKGSSLITGADQDSEGRIFDNVLHYRCYKRTDQTDLESFYIRNSEMGEINLSSKHFVCINLVPGFGGPPPQQDFEFSLSLSRSWKFPIPVESATKLASFNDPNSTGTVRGEFVFNLLGYAAFPNDDESCPSFQDSQGLSRSTYPLRKFLPIDQEKTPIYHLDKDGAVPPPAGFVEDKGFKACAPSASK